MCAGWAIHCFRIRKTSWGDVPMEIGESVNVSIPATSEAPKVLRGEIVKVIFETTIKVAVAKTPVAEPHWETGLNVEEATWTLGKKQISGLFSKRPAAYLCKRAGGSRVATVTVKITESTLSGNGKLIGVLAALRFEGDCPLGAGEHVVVAELKEVPDVYMNYGGNIAWGIEGSEISIALNPTRAELFFLYAAPHRAYQSNGVWVEALRFVASRMMVRGTDDLSDAIAKIVRYCHGAHGLYYDSQGGGRSRYGVRNIGGILNLTGYMARTLPTANCYDQAAAIQALCGAIGILVEWIYMDPYGFIKPTNLLGYGLCNNPFFLGTVPPSQRLVGVNDQQRTPFGNHAFCRRNTKILDACAGPHVGTESAEEYVERSIDAQTSLYRLYRDLRPGLAGEMAPCPGLSGVT